MSYQGQLKIRLIILIFFLLEALHLGEQLLFITLFDTTSVLETIFFFFFWGGGGAAKIYILLAVDHCDLKVRYKC